jgi:hypothetical protein
VTEEAVYLMAAEKQRREFLPKWLSPFPLFIPSGTLGFGMVLPTFRVGLCPRVKSLQNRPQSKTKQKKKNNFKKPTYHYTLRN